MLHLLIILILAAWVSPLRATPYWTDEDAELARREQHPVERPPLPSQPLRGSGPEYVSDFAASAWFIASMQVTDSQSPNYGGIMEGEHLQNIIQTDNTSESIWVFSRYYELTGDASILPYIDASWTYVLNFPAYAEEGTSFPPIGYYRYYNCGWAVRGGMKYKEVFGDATHQAYVDSCANYLATHTLNLTGSEFNQRVNPPVLAWGAGNLRAYGAAEANSFWLTKASNKGGTVKGWVEANSTILSTEEWAMSGGAVMWGILESYFDEFPGEEAAWVTTYSPEMDTIADSGAFENAWHGWYALGEKALEESTGDPNWGVLHLALTDYLRAFDDTDNDGGIMARASKLDSQDQSWITAYLEFMGLEPLLQVATGVLTPPLAIFESNATLLPNRPNPFRESTTVPFLLTKVGRASVEVIDLAGRRVALLADGTFSAGEHTLEWNGRNDRGRPVESGVYFSRMRVDGSAETRKILLLR